MRVFHVAEAPTVIRPMLREVYTSQHVVDYFGPLPEETTIVRVKALAQWLRLEKLRAQLTARHTVEIAKLFRRAAADTADFYQRVPAEASLFEHVGNFLRTPLERLLVSLYSDAGLTVAPIVDSFVRLRRKDLEILTLNQLPFYREWMIQTAAQMVTRVTQNTIRNIARIIDDSVRRELSIDATAAMLRTAHGFSELRAQRIARTEVIAASNSVMYHATQRFYNTGDATKDWLATNDKRTRPTHVRAGSTQKDIEFHKDFNVGGFPALFPGDARLPAKERVQCRCTVIYHTTIV